MHDNKMKNANDSSQNILSQTDVRTQKKTPMYRERSLAYDSLPIDDSALRVPELSPAKHRSSQMGKQFQKDINKQRMRMSPEKLELIVGARRGKNQAKEMANIVRNVRVNENRNKAYSYKKKNNIKGYYDNMYEDFSLSRYDDIEEQKKSNRGRLRLKLTPD